MRGTSKELGAVLLALLLGAVAADARRFDVNALDDAVDVAPGDGVCADARGLCTLRAAVQEANALAGPDEIVLGPGLHELSIAGPDEDEAATGDLDVTGDLTLRGAGPELTWVGSVAGFDDGLVHALRTDPSLMILSLGLRGNPAVPEGVGVTTWGGALSLRDVALEEHLGGAVWASGEASVQDCRITANPGLYSWAFHASSGSVRRTQFVDNGVEDVQGTLFLSSGVVEDCLFRGNRGDVAVDAVAVRRTRIVSNPLSDYPGLATACIASSIEDCVIADNASSGVGFRWGGSEYLIARTLIRGNASVGVGILLDQGRLRIESSTIADNRSTQQGAACYTDHNCSVARPTCLTIVNSTISGNVAQVGGGALWFPAGRAEVLSSTIVGNVALEGEGGGVAASSWGGVLLDVIVRDSILWGNMAPVGPDCFAILDSPVGLLIGDPSDCDYTPGLGNLVGVDPMLGPLADNGGPTPTHALLPGSPAIDAGSATGCIDSPAGLLANDQRGAPRQVDGDSDGIARCDIGAYEYGVDVAVEGLVERTVVLSPPGAPERIAEAFAGACRESPWRPCPEYRWPGPLDGMTLPEVVRRYAQPRVTFYEHSDPATDVRVSLVGEDLVFALP